MNPINSLVLLACWTLAVSFLALGCGANGLQTVEVHGTVTCDGENVETGLVRFVPIEGTAGPASSGKIEGGQYRIESRGGVPIGKHRVEVDARKKTGTKVPALSDQSILIEETVRLGSEVYFGRESPLVLDVTADSDGRFNIEIPVE